MASIWLQKIKLAILLLVLQVIFIVLFAISTDYEDSARPPASLIPRSTNTSQAETLEGKGHREVQEDHKEGTVTPVGPVAAYYPMFQDVHVMVFIGFGLLMTFLRRYGFSSLGVTMLLAAVSLQWAMLIVGYFHGNGGKIQIGIKTMLTAEFASAAVLITMGALLGKTSPLQLVVIAFLEIVVFAFNEWLGVTKLQAVDVGGSMFIHAFGAYFGLAVSGILYTADVAKSTKSGSEYHSDVFAMIGTIFLWLFWPSFNSALAVEDAQHRAVINTYLALASCCIITFVVSSLTNKHGKFDMVHVQNATLAGGVAVGTSADMMIGPHGALLIGAIAGALSVIGFKYLTPFLTLRLKLQDICGVNNLHGMPAIMGAVAGSVAALLADMDSYGYTLYRQFPARMPANESSADFQQIKEHLGAVSPGLDRTALQQAAFQIAALVLTILIAVVGGVLAGLIVRFLPLNRPSGESLFEDEDNWVLPEGPQCPDSGGTLLPMQAAEPKTA